MARRDLVDGHREELKREIARGHVLHGRDWEIIGLGVPARDDALLLLDDGAVALVHVTWRGAPVPPRWPMTVFVSSVDEFRAELEDRGYDLARGQRRSNHLICRIESGPVGVDA